MMDNVQIICTLKNIKSFLGDYPSDLLPHSIQKQGGTVIINTDPHTKDGTHWVAIHFEHKSSNAFYFDSYGHPPYNSHIQAFTRRYSTVLDYNTIQLQGPTSIVCGKYYCLFALFMDRRFTPKNTWTCLLLTLQTDKSLNYSHENLELSGSPVVASAVPHRTKSIIFYIFFHLLSAASEMLLLTLTDVIIIILLIVITFLLSS